MRLTAAQMNRGGRPRLPMNADAITQLRDAGHSWRAIARQVGVGCATVRRAYQQRAKTVPKPIPGPSAVNPSQETGQKVELRAFGFARRSKRWRWRHRLSLPATDKSVIEAEVLPS
jgi:hypothetical protein